MSPPDALLQDDLDELLAIAQQVVELPDRRFIMAIHLLDQVSGRPEARHLLDQARARLRKLKPSRPLNLRRLFCLPFEDLLHDDLGERAGRVTRRAIEPVWSEIIRRASVPIDGLKRELETLSPHQPQQIAALAEKLWAVTTAAMAEPWPEAPRSSPLMLACVAVGAEIQAIKQAVPVTGLAEYDKATIAAIMAGLTRLRAASRPVDGYLLALSVRLKSPRRLLAQLGAHDHPVPREVAAAIDQLALGDLDSEAQQLGAMAPILRASRVSVDANRITRTLGEVQDNASKVMRAGIEKSAATWIAPIRRAVKEQVIDPAVETIAGAAGPAPSIEDWSDAEESARALRLACQLSAKALGLGSEAEAARAKAGTNARAAVEAAMEAVRSAREMTLAGDLPAAVTGELFRAIRMVELVEGNREVPALMARALAALAPK